MFVTDKLGTLTLSPHVIILWISVIPGCALVLLSH